PTLSEIESNATLVGIEVEKQPAFLGMGDTARKWSPLACCIATSGCFHLDDVRAQVGHEFGCIRRRHQAATLDDSHPFQCPFTHLRSQAWGRPSTTNARVAPAFDGSMPDEATSAPDV